MGQMVKTMYAGAFITLKSRTKENGKKFQDIVRDDPFYENFDGMFMYPYQGLEDIAILLPNNKNYNYKLDEDEEFVINKEFLENLNLKEIEDKLIADYKEPVNYLNNLFDNNVVVNSGIVSYWDEIA